MSDNMLEKVEPKTTELVKSSFDTNQGFELMQRQAKCLATSQLVPKSFQGKMADCIIALEMANRIGASPFMVLQNLYIVHGKPSWSAQFLVSCVNACGRFSPLRYRQTGEKNTDTWGVIAWAKDLEGDEILESPEVTIAMAKAEGWYQKTGSKWQTIPELMLRYRAATFFARTYAPDVAMGMSTKEEMFDIVGATDIEVEPSPIEKDDSPKPAIIPIIETVEEVEPEPIEEITPPDKLSRSALIAEFNCRVEQKTFKDITVPYLVGTSTKEIDLKEFRKMITELREAE